MESSYFKELTMDKKELLKLYNLPLDELMEKAKKFTSNKIEFCAIINAKSGKCSENCNYCAQSGHHKTKAEIYPLISEEEILEKTIEAKKNLATRVAIVTSGKRPVGEDFNKICNAIEKMSKIEGIKTCASLGIATKEQIEQLKIHGLKRFHHNLNSSKNYYPKVCTTHTWQDRYDTCKLVKEAGLELCSGVIIGMGESVEDRIDMALELKSLEPESIPVNILIPVQGTPFEGYGGKITEEEILRTLAVFKIVNPNSKIRFAGGKIRLSNENQEIAYQNCVESTIIGDMLTTTGKCVEEDCKMAEKLNKEIVKL